MPTAEEFAGPTTELLQSLIRNECVNDGTPDSGNEFRNADLLTDYFEGSGCRSSGSSRVRVGRRSSLGSRAPTRRHSRCA